MGRASAGSRLIARLRAWDAALPPAARWGAWAALSALATPWMLRAYAAWWDLAWNRPCAALNTFLPRVLPAALVALTATVPVSIAVPARDALLALAILAGCGPRIPPEHDARGMVVDPREPRATMMMQGADDGGATMLIVVICERSEP